MNTDWKGQRLKTPKPMRRRRTLITSPLEWQMAAAPVPPRIIPVLADRGGTQLKTPRAVLVIDTREQNPLDFSRFEGWFAGIEKKVLKLGDYSIAGLRSTLSAWAACRHSESFLPRYTSWASWERHLTSYCAPNDVTFRVRYPI